ncbi:MAG: hypothetical protein ACPK85_07750 [Methanosarcina sp.]
MNNSYLNQSWAEDSLGKDKRIKFPSGSYQVLHDGVCYKIDPENGAVKMTQRLNPSYGPESKEEATNLFNKLGPEKVHKKASLFSKLLLISILTFLLLAAFQIAFSKQSEQFLSFGRYFTLILEIAFLYKFGYYRAMLNYYKDSHCEKCGKYFVFEEFKAPLMKEESKADTYLKTLTTYWRCKNCGFEDIRVESQPVKHHHEEKQDYDKADTCEECGKKDAMEEYRKTDVLNYIARKTIRYFRCRHCGYREIRFNVKFGWQSLQP